VPVFSTAFGSPIHSLFLFHSFLFTYRIPAHLDAMGVVHECYAEHSCTNGVTPEMWSCRRKRNSIEDLWQATPHLEG